MKIVTVPHPSLRQVATAITQVDTKLVQLIQELSQTLDKKQRPAGVGLAAPQVDRGKRLFVTKLPPPEQPDGPDKIQVYLNPEIVDHSSDLTFGPDPDSPTLEGCLSIPLLYGPIPRYVWIQIQYQELTPDLQLRTTTAKLEWFAARVFQHELDHLDGILFTDYSLKYDLPVYHENKRGQFEEVEKSILEGF